jgi:mannose-6-phosphate isomerase-like protein (cupin superfamily)
VSGAHIVALGDGELVDLGKISMEIVEDGSLTDHRLGVARFTVPPQTAGPPQHKHTEHDEGFLVTMGRLVFLVGTEKHEASVGTWVMVPIGIPHSFANPFDEPAEFINTFTPDFYVQFFHEMSDLAKRNAVTIDNVRELMARYRTEVV